MFKIFLFMVLAMPWESSGQEDWMPLDGAGITAALTDRQLQYESAGQIFRADGTTTYYSRGESPGRWSVRGAQYCSVWPPVTDWECYDMRINADKTAVQFIDKNGGVTKGRYRNGER